MLTCLLALVLTGLTLIFSTRGIVRQLTKSTMNVHASVIADNCKASLAFDDPADAKEALSSAHAIAGLQYAAIFNKEGKIFASCDDAEKKLEPNFRIQPDGSYLDEGFITVFKVSFWMMRKSEPSTSNAIWNCCTKIYKTLTLTVIAAGLVAFLAAYLVSTRLQRWISGPILRIAETARYVSQKRIIL